MNAHRGGKPPTESRFKKGQSGNPKVRPPKKAPASSFDIILDKSFTVEADGASRKLSPEDLLAWKTYQDALGGDWAACKEVLRMIKVREAAGAKLRRLRRDNVVIEKEAPDPDNADQALIILGIASRQPLESGVGTGRLQLESWAIEQALARRRGPLSAQDLENIKICTHDTGGINWPSLE